MTSISRIVKVGDTDISPYVRWGSARAKGAGRKMKTSAIIGSSRAVVWEEGREPLALKAELQFMPTLADQIGDDDEISALIDDLSGNQETDRLYFGRTDRFAVVYGSVGDSEIGPSAGGGGIVRKTAEFWAEAAELYAATPTAWDDDGELPLTMAEAIENAGNLDAGLYSLEVEAGAETALKLDGDDDYIDAGAVDLGGNAVSFEFLLTMDEVPTDYYPGLVAYHPAEGDHADAGSLQMAINPPLVAGTNSVYWGFGDDLDPNFAFVDNVAFGVPVHLVITHDVTNEEAKVYIDGILAATLDITGAPAIGTAFCLEIAGGRGTFPPGDGPLGCTMNRVRIWTRILSATEVEDAYNGDTVSDTDLVLHYDFSEGEGATLTDLSGEGNDGTLMGFAEGESGWMSVGLEGSIALELLDDEAEVVASIALSPGLFPAEVLEVDRFGQIRQEYADGYDSGVRFGNDGFEDGTVAVADGSLVIETSSYAGYALVGQWPLKKGGLLVTFTPTEAGTGEAFLEASIDQGDSWLEVSSNSQWVDGAENEIYVPQAEGYVEVWIRWRCDGDITSLSIDDLQIVQLRAVSDADVPKIPAGEERVLQVSGTGRAIISAEYRDRFKP